MQHLESIDNRRILVIDDNEDIHKEFHKILGMPFMDNQALDQAEAAILGEHSDRSKAKAFEIDSAFMGQEGVRKVKQSIEENRPYAVVFVDIRMPPGWDGIETIKRLWQVDPSLQIVSCAAYSDFQQEDFIEKLGLSKNLLILKKPFESIELLQQAYVLAEKWQIQCEAKFV